MKLKVLTWLRDEILSLLGNSVELIFRLVLLVLPMGLFLLLIQAREKASKTSNLSNYLTDNSTWQNIFPGFLLVAIDPNLTKNAYRKAKINFQSWMNENKYLLSFLFMSLIVILMIIKG